MRLGNQSCAPLINIQGRGALLYSRNFHQIVSSLYIIDVSIACDSHYAKYSQIMHTTNSALITTERSYINSVQIFIPVSNPEYCLHGKLLLRGKSFSLLIYTLIIMANITCTFLSFFLSSIFFSCRLDLFLRI